MEQARAAATLFSDDAKEADRLAAVEVIHARGDLDSRALLDGLSNQPPAVAKAAAAADRRRSIVCCSSGVSCRASITG